MKNLNFIISILFISIIFGCNAENKINNRIVSMIDSTQIFKNQIDSIKRENKVLFNRTIQLNNDLLVIKNLNNKLNDSLIYCNKTSYDEYNNLLTLIKIKRYASICTSNPKNKVFLLGWINRSLRKVNFNSAK